MDTDICPCLVLFQFPMGFNHSVVGVKPFEFTKLHILRRNIKTSEARMVTFSHL